MKHMFFLKSAVSLMGLISASAVFAANTAPKITLSGEGNAAFYSFNASQKQGNGGRGNGLAAGAEDTRLNIEAEGMTLEYGGLIFNYLMGIAGKTNPGSNAVEESRIMVKGSFGRIIIGAHRPVGDRMAKGTHNTQVASGGVMGNYTNVINITTGVNKSVDLVGTAKDANKISFISPRVSGFQLGVSFTPSSTRQGDDKLSTRVHAAKTGLPFTKNNLEASLNYIQKHSKDLTWKASLSGVYAKGQRGSPDATSFTPYDAKSYALGVEVAYKAFTWGAEFIDNGKSLASKEITGQNAGKVYSTGLSYAMGKNTVSVGYLHSHRNLGNITYDGKQLNPQAKANVYTAGFERKVAPGLKLYAEGTRFLYQTHQSFVSGQKALKQITSSVEDGIGNNQGTVFLAGTKVTF